MHIGQRRPNRFNSAKYIGRALPFVFGGLPRRLVIEELLRDPHGIAGGADVGLNDPQLEAES